MNGTPPQKPAPVPPQQPAPQPTPQPVKPAVPPAPAPVAPQPTKPVAPAPTAALLQPAKPGVPAQPAKPGISLPKDQSKSNKRFVVGCLSTFGCSLILFLGVLFGFIAFGDVNNPIFGFLGVPPGQVINFLITLVNFIFLVLVFITFILVIVGIFRIATAKKDDKEARRKGTVQTFISVAFLVLFIFLWIAAFFFLAPKRTVAQPKTPITTEPEKTTNLTAPITITFDASKAPINKKQFEILSYNWDFGDAAKATGVKQTHTYEDLGDFVATLTIKVREIATKKEQNVEFTKDVTIQNVLAKVVIKADKTKGGAPLTVQLDGSESSSPNGEITAFAWDLDGDGEFDDSAEAEASALFDKIGAYKISLRVTDSTGTFATNELEIEVTPPDDPIPVITVEGAEGTDLETNKSYVFSAADSTSPGGSIEKYQWEMSDGGEASTRTVTYIYKEVGEYDVTLTITDSTGKKGTKTVRYKVTPPASAPVPSFKTTPAAVNDELSGEAPFTVQFDASGSKDPNDNIVEYAWDFNGDSKTDDTNALASYTFQTAGTYTVTLTVIDSTNLSTKATIKVAVTAAGLKAMIKADPVSGTVPLTVKFDATGSSYPDGNIVAYEWDFGDGKAPRTDIANVSYQYTSIGTFISKVTVITSDNKRANSEVPITVRPVALKACFEASVSAGKSPLQVQFDPTCSTGTVIKYRWKFGELGSSLDRKPSFTFQNAGEYSIALEVADSQNVVDTFTMKITAN